MRPPLLYLFLHFFIFSFFTASHFFHFSFFLFFSFAAQVNEYKYEIERVNRELQEVKRKYYQQKRREQLIDELEGSAGMGMQGK